MSSVKKQNDTTLEREPLGLAGVQYAAWEERRATPHSSREKEVAGTKQK